MDGLARAQNVMFSQRAHRARVRATFKSRAPHRLREAFFLFASFSLDERIVKLSATTLKSKLLQVFYNRYVAVKLKFSASVGRVQA